MAKIQLGVLSRAVLAQASALLLVLAALRLGVFGWPALLWVAVSVQAIIAALVARLLRCDRWWILIHLVFTPGIAAALALQLPSYWYLIGFIVLALLFGPAVRHRVPLFLSNHATQMALSEKVSPYWMGSDDRFIDLGSGTGSMAIGFSKMNPHVSCTGIEEAWLPYGWSRWRALGNSNLELRQGNFWECDLGSYRVVYAFLSTEPMGRLWQKVAQEMRPGSVFVSNSFQVPDVEPTSIAVVNDSRQTHLYFYAI